MKLIRTDHFTRDYKKLPARIQEQTDNKLRYLVRDIRHPSLRVKRVRRYRDIFEGSITTHYRFLFKITSGGYILLRAGRHDILEKL